MTLPPLDEVLDRLHVVSLPLVTRFRGVDTRELALIEGPEGWTEFSPFMEYDDRESSTWLAAALEYGWSTTPPARRDLIPVNATVPAVPAASVPEVLARFAGCRTAKVKVADPGQRLDDDVARVAAVREAMGPEGRIRIDANGAWNIDEAEHAVRAMEHYDLEYVEQPCASIDELAELRRRISRLDIPVAADESVRKADDPLAVARAEAADLLVIKAQPLGGVSRAMRIVAEAGLPVVVSSALDSAVGLSMGAALAAALPDLPYDCGLGTGALFTEDVADYATQNGALRVVRPIPDPAVVERRAVDAERRQWWVDRIVRCHALPSLG
ncbi:o-succinylbenzoate synthase [Microbacterium sp. ET2]|uniref:o-succinylbenzoate synthase n=1 Tax=Microbacterium albipurpureum TaxID=3050384 RepID=UPI00259C94A7|nr:o-succinylbenzoate synthase [Microbacterium sp. ET2 (Ac-2212)]WJL96436.1 o-succinylbenzoate synthase [Microbacterium sp. ET2 (Ac-2212)]